MFIRKSRTLKVSRILYNIILRKITSQSVVQINSLALTEKNKHTALYLLRIRKKGKSEIVLKELFPVIFIFFMLYLKVSITH